MENPIEMDYLGVPLFQETTILCTWPVLASDISTSEDRYHILPRIMRRQTYHVHPPSWHQSEVYDQH